MSVYRVRASEHQSGTPIELSIDGRSDTHFHSRWNGTEFPVFLTYYFNNVERINYVLYFVRSGDTVGSANGNLQELEIWVADNGSSTLRKYGSFDFDGANAQVIFNPPLINPTRVEFRVLSGVNDFVSVGEMRFYGNVSPPANRPSFDADPASWPTTPTGSGGGVQVTVQSAQSNRPHQGNQSIQQTLQPNNNLFHTTYGAGTTVFPVILTYNFSNVDRIDYVQYLTRVSGTNGNIQEVEIWVADNGGGLRRYGLFDFNGASAQVRFYPPLINPTRVEFRVLSGIGGWVSVREMRFFAAPDLFDYLEIFTNHCASRLRPHVTRAMIEGIPDEFFRELALQIYSGTYDPFGFRVQEYRAWIHPSVQADANRTWPYSLRDNPTGIFVRNGQELIVFVAGLERGQTVSIVTQDLTYLGASWGRHRTYLLSAGMNRINITADGLVYVLYFSPLEERAPRLRIHFATGYVNGFFDVRRHTREQWQTLLANAVAPDFDLVGTRAHLKFPVTHFRRYTPDGMALVQAWDDVVRLQHEFMGLYRHDRVFRNRLFAHVDRRDNSPWMYATRYRTGYSLPTLQNILNVDRFRTGSIWGPAHEVGHVNQVRPGVAWNGMGEVTVNIYSMHVQRAFGNTSRLTNTYAQAFNNVLGKDIPHRNIRDANDRQDYFVQLVPFWQLYLYLVYALGQTYFYMDLFHHYMANNPNPQQLGLGNTDGRWQLYFVLTASRISGFNLTHFFREWGFLTSVNTGPFVITQEHVDALLRQIDALGLPDPPHDFTRITDSTAYRFRS